MVYQNHKSCSFRVVEVFCKDPFLALYYSLFSSMIILFLCLLPSAALLMLTIWPFGPSPPWSPLQWRPHKELCFNWSTGRSSDVFLSIRTNVKHPYSQLTPTKPSSFPSSRLHFNSTLTFLGITFDRTLSFSKHVSSLKAKFFPRLKVLGCISASHVAPVRSPSLFYIRFSSAPSHICLT